jgi:hypothetical protein
LTEAYKQVEKSNFEGSREDLAIEDGFQHIEEVDGLEVTGGMTFRIVEGFQFTREVDHSDL